FVGLGLVIPFAGLREIPLHTAGMAGLSAYLFTYYGSHGGFGNHLHGFAVGMAAVLVIALLGGLASLAVTGLYFVVGSLVLQVAIERVVFTRPKYMHDASVRGVWQPKDPGWLNTPRRTHL